MAEGSDLSQHTNVFN